MSGRASPPSAFNPRIAAREQPFDPLRLCIYTTIAILAWMLTPAIVVSVFSGIALVAYYKARRQGLVQSKCKLGDTRLVMAYLAIAFLLSVGFTLYQIVHPVEALDTVANQDTEPGSCRCWLAPRKLISADMAATPDRNEHHP